MTGTIELKSSVDGSTLTFSKTASSRDGIDFDVAVRTPFFAGVAPASTYLNGSPSLMFAEMAKEWRGWKGTKRWSDLEKRVTFEAECDSLGHIKLVVELIGQDYDAKLRVLLGFDSGQLDAIHQSIAELLG